MANNERKSTRLQIRDALGVNEDRLLIVIRGSLRTFQRASYRTRMDLRDEYRVRIGQPAFPVSAVSTG